ncbi:hypothetical protein GCM10027597_35940 [Saccharopolyspora tripterygii]
MLVEIDFSRKRKSVVDRPQAVALRFACPLLRLLPLRSRGMARGITGIVLFGGLSTRRIGGRVWLGRRTPKQVAYIHLVQS